MGALTARSAADAAVAKPKPRMVAEINAVTLLCINFPLRHALDRLAASLHALAHYSYGEPFTVETSKHLGLESMGDHEPISCGTARVASDSSDRRCSRVRRGPPDSERLGDRDCDLSQRPGPNRE